MVPRREWRERRYPPASRGCHRRLHPFPRRLSLLQALSYASRVRNPWFQHFRETKQRCLYCGIPPLSTDQQRSQRRLDSNRYQKLPYSYLPLIRSSFLCSSLRNCLVRNRSLGGTKLLLGSSGFSQVAPHSAEFSQWCYETDGRPSRVSIITP